MNPPTPRQTSARSEKNSGAHDSPESIETFPLRTKRPGRVGLANEMRPGRGTRATDAEPRKPGSVERETDAKGDKPEGKTAVPPPPTEQPEPLEQDSESLAQQQQRSTGVSGHAGGT